MTRIYKTLHLTLIISLVWLLLTDANTVKALPDTHVVEKRILTTTEKETRLDDSPEEPFYPASIPFYQVPLSVTPHDHFLLSRPINQESIIWRTADYRYGFLIKKDEIVHYGLDIPAPERTPVLAAGSGTVTFSGYGMLYGEGAKNDPYGIAVIIRHDFEHDGYTTYTIYTHLDKALVKVNETVNVGQKIGGVGMTGTTSGPHLHFEVRIRDNRGLFHQNPELWLIPPINHGVLAGRITNNLGYVLNNWNIRLTSLDTGKVWQIRTYDQKVTSYQEFDPFYQENFVLNDLPAGRYELFTYYNYVAYKYEFELVPGAVNYVQFIGKQGFVRGDPPGSLKTDFLN